jgi:predicted O-methyltransferase YrrM
MEHFYQSIAGYFTFPDFYTWLANKLRDKQRVVEVGVYTGQSAAYLAVELHNLSSRCKLDLVDFDFTGSVERVRDALAPVSNVLGEFRTGLSWEAAKHYDDASLDAAFLDADHVYESIRKDIDAWLPKIKPGGYLAGHDFTLFYPGVIQAVTETFDRWTIWRGIRHGGDAQMQGKYWPVWCVQVGEP